MIFNKRFGRYTLVKKLAMGGMAEVYLALKRGPSPFERLVALKMLHEHLVEDQTHVDMFFQEARLSALFDHPNLVTVFDADTIDGRPTMVMEFVPGATLDAVVQRIADAGEKFPIEMAMAIASEAAHGLHAAHTASGLDGGALSVVHRDISPHNILISHHDGGVRVFDFGVAVAAGSTEHGQLAGKTAYMSPEQCRGKHIDARSDVFSLGIVLHELITGRPLFKRDNHIQSIRAITEDTIEPPSAARDGVAPEVDAIVMKALARNADERFASAWELHAALAEELARRDIVTVDDELVALTERHFKADIDEIDAVVQKILLAPERSEATIDLATFDLRSDAEDGPAIHTDAGAALGGGASRSGGPVDVPATAALGEQLRRARRTIGVLGTVAALAVLAAVGLALTGGLPGMADEEVEDTAAAQPDLDVVVTVESDPPGASIEIDGALREETTPAQFLLPAAPTSIRVSSPGYLASTFELQPNSDDSASSRVFATLDVDPDSEYAPIGELRVVYRPEDATVYYEGDPVGSQSPVTIGSLPLNTEIQLRLSRDGYETLHFPIVVDSAEPLEVQLELAEAVELGVLTVDSRPARAEVRINDEVMGETPLEGLELPANQTYTVEIRRAGHQRWRRAIVLRPGEVSELMASLESDGTAPEPEAEPDVEDDAAPAGAAAAPEPEPEPEPEYELLLE